MLYAYMQIGKSTTMQEVKDLDSAGNITRNLNMSALKDTITVLDGGYSIVRIHATNPGTLEFRVYCMETSQFKVYVSLRKFFFHIVRNVQEKRPSSGDSDIKYKNEPKFLFI